MSWYQKAADQGNADAQFNLGLIYGKGTSAPQNDAQSLFWFRKAADQGDSNGQFALGIMYETAKGVEQDYKQAARWYKKAAVKGNSNAQINLGCLYLNGNGVEHDRVEALKWFMLAPACTRAEETLNKAISCLDVAMKTYSSENAAEAQKRSVDDPMFDPTPAYIISRVTEWRKETTVFFDEILQKHAARSKGAEHDQKLEAYDDTTKAEIARSFRETFTFYGTSLKVPGSNGTASPFFERKCFCRECQFAKSFVVAKTKETVRD